MNVCVCVCVLPMCVSVRVFMCCIGICRDCSKEWNSRIKAYLKAEKSLASPVVG